MAVFMSRDAKLYISIEDPATTIWRVPILDGFSFSQSSESSDITLTEANSSEGLSRRGKKTFNTGLAAAEFSFSTYVRPFKTLGSTDNPGHASDTLDNVHGVEEVLWAMFAGADGHTVADGVFDYSTSAISVQANGTSNTFDFSESNQPVFNTAAKLQFFIPNGGDGGTGEHTLYTLEKAVINEATIDFDIEGIAQISWSGMAQSITTTTGAGVEPTAIIYEGETDTTAFIQNRLSKVAITASDTTNFPGVGGGSDGVYNITLTGGSVTFTNNISSLMPEEMGVVNQSVGLITGTREVSGSLTCYLDSGTGGSRDFFEAFQGVGALAVPTNSFALTLQIGGTTGPRLEIPMPTAMFELPTLAIDDVVGVEANFFGLAENIETTDEATIVYKV